MLYVDLVQSENCSETELKRCCTGEVTLVTAVCLSPGKTFWESWKVLKFFCKHESGNPVFDDDT